MTTTKTITIIDLNVGDIVRFHGARFEIYNAAMYPEHDDQYKKYGPVMVAHGKWLDGAEVLGYFGRNQDWTFQGNKNACAVIEVDVSKK